MYIGASIAPTFPVAFACFERNSRCVQAGAGETIARFSACVPPPCFRTLDPAREMMSSALMKVRGWYDHHRLQTSGLVPHVVEEANEADVSGGVLAQADIVVVAILQCGC
jgi:hypothetical protein